MKLIYLQNNTFHKKELLSILRLKPRGKGLNLNEFNLYIYIG
jgi:hypothetical protein